MRYRICLISALIIHLLAARAICQQPDTVKAKEAAGNSALQTMLDYSAPTAAHAALGKLAGTWNFQDAKLAFVKGSLVRERVFEGRFYNVTIKGGKLMIPVGPGQMKEANYQGFQIEGYDNVKAMYVTVSLNNHIGSDIQMETGAYDAAKNSFTYSSDSELLPGAKVKNMRTITIKDADHYIEQYFELRNGAPVMVRELDYTRASR